MFRPIPARASTPCPLRFRVSRTILRRSSRASASSTSSSSIFRIPCKASTPKFPAPRPPRPPQTQGMRRLRHPHQLAPSCPGRRHSLLYACHRERRDGPAFAFLFADASQKIAEFHEAQRAKRKSPDCLEFPFAAQDVDGRLNRTAVVTLPRGLRAYKFVRTSPQ